MGRAHFVKVFHFSGSITRVEIDGKIHDIDLAAQSPRLAEATQKQIENVVVSPSGYGLHWPDLDEDLSIDGLIGIKHAPLSGQERT